MCYTSFKDFDAICKLLPLQWQIADLSLHLVGPTLLHSVDRQGM